MRKIYHNTLFFLLVMVTCNTMFAQQSFIVRGRVFDKADNTALVGATAIEYDKEDRVVKGTISDINGDFVLEMSRSENTLRVSYIGYQTKTIVPTGSAVFIVELESTSTAIDEVTVTAQSGMSNSLTNINERDNATSTVKVDFSELRESGMVSAFDALQGKVTGLDIISASGDPGSGSQLVIRGLSSMGNSKPLIVIDGIPQNRVREDFDLTSATSEDISNLINISLQDIKSIEVLKDAASTAVYGSRGADGVLLIETFRGQMGEVKFDYQYKSSINFQPPAIEMLNGDEYIMLQLEAWHNSEGIYQIPSEIAYDPEYVDFYNYSANTDWLGEITRNSVTHDHYFKLSGGSDRTRYFTSLGYVDEGGTTRNTGYQRFSSRINLDYFLSRKLLFSVQFNYTRNNRQSNLEINRRGVREMAYIKAPNMSIWEYDSEGNPTGEYFTPINSYQGNGINFYNPVAVVDLGKNINLNSNIQNTFNMRYRINNWLTFRETLSFQYTGTKRNEFLPHNAIGTDWLNNNVNKAVEANSINAAFKTETQLAFNVPFSNRQHEMSGALNWITNQTTWESMLITGSKSASAIIQDPSVGSHINHMQTQFSEGREIGALGNLNYKYKDRYMIQTILRTDASSVFGSNNKWGLFKGLAVAWRFSEESFLERATWLNESKLRASYGVSGRQPNDVYARFATYETSNNGSYIFTPAVIPAQIQLSNLRWESLTSYDVGLELNMFNNDLFLELGYYEKITEDILFNKYKVPFSSGYDELKFLNGGELRNYGFELMFDYKIIKGENLRWSINGNASRNINAFTTLPDNFNTEQGTSISNGEYPKRIIEGEPIGSFFGFRYLGVWASDDEVVARDLNGNAILDGEGNPVPLTYAGIYTFQGGDAKYEDVNGDGRIDLNDVVYIGNSNPDYIGGFGSSVRYKNFDFSIAFNFRYGFDIVNRVAINTQSMNNRNNQSKAVLHRWRVDGQDKEGMLPRAYMGNPANNLGSDRYVERGDFTRLNMVSLAYRLKKQTCQKLGIENASVNLNARKLLTFTSYTGQDPEIGQDASNPFWIGEDRANTPPPRVITISLSIGF